jgi:hypothetical protein
MPTTNVTVDGDVTAGWQKPSGETHFSQIDEGTSAPVDSDFVESDVDGSIDEYTLEASPGNTAEVQTITVNLRARIVDALRQKKIRLELFHSGGTPVSGNPQDVTINDLGGSGITKTISKQWTGLTLTKTQFDSCQLRATNLRS